MLGTDCATLMKKGLHVQTEIKEEGRKTGSIECVHKQFKSVNISGVNAMSLTVRLTKEKE